MIRFFRLWLLVPLWIGSLVHGAVDSQALRDDAAYFTDSSCSELKSKLSAKDVASFKSEVLREVAKGLLAKSYDQTYRSAWYEAYPSPRELGKNLKLGDGFSRYENMTGIYLEQGEHVVLVGPMHGKKISLLLPDWMRKPAEGVKPTKDPNGWGLKRQEVKLQEGVNVIQVEKSTNAYISYFDDHAEEAKPIRVHFPTGKVNGYFDLAKHTDEDWKRLVDQAVSPILDARGKHVQVAYPVDWLRLHTQGRGVELMKNYDKILHHHYTFAGLVKYHKVPKNRILARVNHNYYMFRDGDGVAYLGTKNVMEMVANPDRVIRGDACWGFSHETGHVMQLNPQITWGGMTEVSVNLFSLYTTGALGNPSRLAEQKNFASARKNIIEANPKISYLQAKDVFDRLVPFWQLQLYFTKNGKPDFYADVLEAMRRRPDAGRGNDSILNQFQYAEICCEVAKMDLTDFFEKWGFFYVGEIRLNDYSDYQFKVTQKVVDDVKQRIASKHYPKPPIDLTTVEN